MKTFGLSLLLVLLLSGCATSTVQSRIKQRPQAYAALSPDQKALVDQGRIQVGMTADAVFLSWGNPSDSVESESAQGHITTWIYYGQWVEEYRYWIGRRLESDYYPRDYVQAEIVFKDGRVVSWRTLPKPVG